MKKIIMSLCMMVLGGAGSGHGMLQDHNVSTGHDIKDILATRVEQKKNGAQGLVKIAFDVEFNSASICELSKMFERFRVQIVDRYEPVSLKEFVEYYFKHIVPTFLPQLHELLSKKLNQVFFERVGREPGKTECDIHIMNLYAQAFSATVTGDYDKRLSFEDIVTLGIDAVYECIVIMDTLLFGDFAPKMVAAVKKTIFAMSEDFEYFLLGKMGEKKLDDKQSKQVLLNFERFLKSGFKLSFSQRLALRKILSDDGARSFDKNGYLTKYL